MVGRFPRQFMPSLQLLRVLNFTGQDIISLVREQHNRPTSSPLHDKQNCHLSGDGVSQLAVASRLLPLAFSMFHAA